MKKHVLFLFAIILIALTSCEKDGNEGIKSLVNISSITSNDNCPNGGQKIEIGLDNNRNSKLDSSEVESTSYICNGINGTDGLNSLTNLTEVGPSDICEAGGFRIDAGIDANRNNVLDNYEIESTKYICNGENGGYDKQIMFRLNKINSMAQDTFIYTIQNSGSGILLFNKDNYTDIDSAVFIVYDIKTATGCCGAADIAMKVKIELYDLTNNQPILNSAVESDNIPVGTYVRSNNFINYLPNDYINLGTRMTFDKNYYAVTGDMYLVLYRSE